MKRTIPILISLLWALTATAAEGTFSKDPTLEGGFYLFGPGVGFTQNLYYSDDYGQSLQITVIDTSFNGGIIADAVSGYLINHDGVISLSRDYGITWENTGEAPYNISAGRIPGEIYTFDWIASERVVKYSNDYGETWENFSSSGLVVDDFIYTVGVLEGEFYVVDYDSGWVSRSMNCGEDFTLMGTVQANGYRGGTRLDEGALPGELYYYDGPTGDLFFSSDSGMSFEWKYNFPDTSINYSTKQMQGGNESGEVFFCLKRTYYTGGGEIFIYYSTDYGEHFTEFHPFSTTVNVSEKPHPQPSTYKISCYPNPFNDRAIIQVYNPIGGDLDVQIINPAGRIVYDYGLFLQGTRRFTLDYPLTSGVYYFVVKSDRAMIAKPLIQLK